MNQINKFFSMIDGKFILATIVMIVTFVIICYLIYFLTISLKNRRRAIEVKLPEIEEHHYRKTNGPQFPKDKNVSVELISYNEDVVDEEEPESDESTFLTALALETKNYVYEEDKEELDMPNVGEIDYDKLKEDKERQLEQEKIERDKATINHLKEIAKADSKENITGL